MTKVDKDSNVPCKDLISRQKAQRLFGIALTFKERIGKLTWTTAELKQYIADFVEDLPSAQPEENCDTCKHGYFGSEMCNNCRVGYPSHYEREDDGVDC